jgi:hypothetical protein
MRNALHVCGLFEPILVTRGAGCPNVGLHEPCPTGYGDWHEWAEEKAKTHRQRRCAGCGLFQIWVPRKRRKVRAIERN